jgi:hypothetical protein
MGFSQVPLKVKPFLAVLYKPEIHMDELLKTLAPVFGGVECSYGPVPFDFSDYYREEMGEGLFKAYYTFESLMDRQALPAQKHFTNSTEQGRLAQGNRCVNLDPGYIARDKLVLATTKDFYHRLYLADGIFGEVTLHFRKGEFRHFSWTYPDYQTPAFLEFLIKARAMYMHEVRDEG